MNGVNLSILSLQYTVAPDAVFPRQQQEAVAAYRYLVHDKQVDPSNVITQGESAGRHLVIYCLIGIEEASLTKPGSGLLVAP